MSLFLGVDTGGTYTDAVILDSETDRVLGKAKSLTTRLDLALGIGRAVDAALEAAGVHFMSFSGHKIYAPKGVGGLYVNRRVKFTPLLRGSQENARRGGTQNVASIVGFGKAAEIALQRPRDG